MSLTADIAASYRRPRQVMRRRLADGVREDRALLYVMLGCALIFVSQWPRLSRQAALEPELPFDVLLGGALLSWLFIVPLALYALAALVHLAARLAGGRGGWFGARLALFWSLLAVAPLWLLHGLVAGFLGPGPALDLAGLALTAAFFWIWGNSLIVVEREGGAEIAP